MSVSEQTEQKSKEQKSEESGRPDIGLELQRLLELSVKLPEIAPPLAELAFKLGETDFANRVIRMGLDRGTPGVEYYFVVASAARREGRHADVLKATLDAIRSFVAAKDDALAPDDGSRLLHLVRLAFAVLMFDLADVRADMAFAEALEQSLPQLETRLGNDPFFRSLRAQTLWFKEPEKSEEEWERACALGEPELTWNARGTWYKEAEHDLDKAERAYKSGLEKAANSALLQHNLAQILLDKAERGGEDTQAIRGLLREADELLRAALHEDGPKGLRRHIHLSRERLVALRAKLPRRGAAGAGEEGARPNEPEKLPEVGQEVSGRVVSLENYGAFISLTGRLVGLLHKSEMAHEFVADPASVLKVGDEVTVKVIDVQPRQGNTRPRIGLSRKALLPAPPKEATAAAGEGASASERPRGQGHPDHKRREGRPPRDRGRGGERRHEGRRDGGERRGHTDPRLEKKLASLGEMLLAKMRGQDGEGEE